MIGRKVEQELLQEAIDKERAQFIVVYGRRRVGKTYQAVKKCVGHR